MAKYHQLMQGSAEWRKVRRGIPTSSNFGKIITPKGSPSSQARGYLCKLVCERLFNIEMEGVGSSIFAMERGRLMEREAADDLTKRHKLPLSTVGFVTTDDLRMGCSPDRLVTGRNQAVEIKCPLPWTQMEYLLYGPGDDYIAQVQGQLMIGGWDCIHFYSYHPYMPRVLITTPRKEPYIRALRSMLDEFCNILDKETERAKSLGTFDEYVEGTGMQMAMGIRDAA